MAWRHRKLAAHRYQKLAPGEKAVVVRVIRRELTRRLKAKPNRIPPWVNGYVRILCVAGALRRRLAAPPGFSTLKWANSYIQIHSPHSRMEIERLIANSKFFRSLVPISVALSVHFAVREHEFWLALAALGLGMLSYMRYVEQRWKSTELTYGTAVILHATTLAAKPADASDVATG